MQYTDLCSSCGIKEICTVFQLKKEKMHDIEMVISKCKYASSIRTAEAPDTDKVPKEISSHLQNSDLECESTLNVFSSSFDEDEYKKFLDRQSSVEEDKDIIATCETCGGTCYQSDITICSKCGKVVCANCATGFSGLTYCEKCWEDF